MERRVLTEEQIEQFTERGWVKLEQAFPREWALECQRFIWERLAPWEVDPEDRATWTKPIIYLREAYRTPEFDRCSTRRLADAIEDLVGRGRWSERGVYGEDETCCTWGWWPVNFSLGAERPWDVPATGWHWDGGHFRHYVDSPDQGLLCLCIFSEIGPRGGGTLIVEGSHKVVARFLQRHPDGLEPQEAIDKLNAEHPYLAALTGVGQEKAALAKPSAGAVAANGIPGEAATAPRETKAVPGAAAAADGTGTTPAKPDAAATSSGRIETFMNGWHTDADGFRLRVAETTASPGDVILCHPFLYHTPSQNHSGVPRFMCNQKTPLTERMRFDRSNPADESPLERSIRLALESGRQSNRMP